MRNAIKLVFILMNEILKNFVNLIVMIYDLNEKKLLENDKSMQNHSRLLLRKYQTKRNYAKFSIEFLIAQSKFMKRILATYLEDIVLQRIMKVKTKKQRRSSIDFTRKEYKFELNDCEIKNDKIL